MDWVFWFADHPNYTWCITDGQYDRYNTSMYQGVSAVRKVVLYAAACCTGCSICKLLQLRLQLCLTSGSAYEWVRCVILLKGTQLNSQASTSQQCAIWLGYIYRCNVCIPPHNTQSWQWSCNTHAVVHQSLAWHALCMCHQCGGIHYVHI